MSNNTQDQDYVDADATTAEGVFDIDAELEGVQPAAEFQDPVPGTHIFYVRPYFKQGTREVEDGVIHLGQVIYEILASESEAALHTVGGLFSENFTLGGAVVEYEKYSAVKQVVDGKKGFVGRLSKFGADEEAKTSEKMEQINEAYEPDAELETGGICAKVSITAKLSKDKEFANIKKVRVIDPEFPLINTAAEGEAPTGIFTAEDYKTWEFWAPNGD